MENIFNGFYLINGSGADFNVGSIQNYDKKTLYFIRTNESNNDGYLYFNGKKYGTGIDAVAALSEEIKGILGYVPAENEDKTLKEYIDAAIAAANTSASEAAKEAKDAADKAQGAADAAQAAADNAQAAADAAQGEVDALEGVVSGLTQTVADNKAEAAKDLEDAVSGLTQSIADVMAIADTAVQSVNGKTGKEVVIDAKDAKVGEYTATEFAAVDGVEFEAVSAEDTINGAIKKVESNVAKLVQETIDNELVVAEATNAIKVAAGLDDNLEYVKDADANYIKEAASLADADSKLDAAIKELAGVVEGLDSEADTKIDSIKDAAGLSADYKYVQNTEAAHIANATSLADADNKLDAAIKAVEDEFATFTGETAIVEVVYEGQYIKLKNKKGEVTKGFDASAFIKDGMIDSVVHDASANTITITWNTDAGKEATVINLGDLVDVYVGDDKTVKVENNTISAITDQTDGLVSWNTFVDMFTLDGDDYVA